jgi:hypothetical protein
MNVIHGKVKFHIISWVEVAGIPTFRERERETEPMDPGF